MSIRKQVIVLGGGVGALTTAYYLTTRPNWQEEYDITVHQLGWRLGGKGASSRNPDEHDRIEEHGLHVWFGFYENAFATMRAVYDELPRRSSAKLGTIDQAFQPLDRIPMLEQIGDRWSVWPFDFPELPGAPGDPGAIASGWEVLTRLLEYVRDLWHWDGLAPSGMHSNIVIPRWGQDLLKPDDTTSRLSPLHLAIHLMKALPAHPALHDKDLHHSDLVALLRQWLEWIRTSIGDVSRAGESLRRAWVVAELGICVAIGILEDELLCRGLASIDGEEFRAWLARHGAGAEVLDSTPVRALYDCCFAYENGDVARPNFAAGVALGCALRIGLMYRGHLLYQMQAGMGDVVVAPLYEVLRARGVKFEFFQRVRKIEVEGGRVARVQFGRQVRLKNGRYEPLVSVRGMHCWPNKPLYDQIEDGDRLAECNVNLESHWAAWTDVESWTLEVREEDRVVLGISLGGLAEICQDLSNASEDWKNMIDQLPTIRTQSAQLWMRRDLSQLGWRDTAKSAMVAAPEPYDVWADMSHLIACEGWPPDDRPLSIQYLCGPMKGDGSNLPPPDPDTPEKAWKDARAQIKNWLDDYAGWIWPAAVSAGSRGFDWEVLHAAGNLRGEARLDAQWIRANVDPTERYVLSPARVNRFRLPGGESGFRNLVLAGDWTRTAINAGCVEAAVMSGMEASRALCGYPREIVGEHFMQG